MASTVTLWRRMFFPKFVHNLLAKIFSAKNLSSGEINKVRNFRREKNWSPGRKFYSFAPTAVRFRVILTSKDKDVEHHLVKPV